MTIKQFFLCIVSLSIAFHSPLFSSGDDDETNSHESIATKKKPIKQRAFLQQEQSKETHTSDFFFNPHSPRLDIFSKISHGRQVITGVQRCEELERTFFESADSPRQHNGIFLLSGTHESEEIFSDTRDKDLNGSDDQPFDERLYLGSLLDSTPGIYPSTPSLEQTIDDDDESFFSQPPFFEQQECSSSSTHVSDQTTSFFGNLNEFLDEDHSLASSNNTLGYLSPSSPKIMKKRPISWEKLLKRARAYKKNYDAHLDEVFMDITPKNLALRITQTPLVWHNSLSKKRYKALSKYSKKNSDIHAIFALIFCGETFLKTPTHKDQRSILTRLLKKHQKECSCIESDLAQANLLTLHYFSAPTPKHYSLAKEKWISCIEQMSQHEEKSQTYLDYARYQVAHLMTYSPTLCTVSDLEDALSTLYTYAFSGNYYAMFSLGLACFDPYLEKAIQEHLWPKTQPREHYLRGLRFLQTALRVEENNTSWAQTAYERTRATLGDEKAALLFTPKKGHPPLITNVSGKTLHRFYA